MLKQSEAMEKAVAILKVVFKRDFTQWDNANYIPTNNVDNGMFDVLGYFNPESDNADVLYTIVENEIGFSADDDMNAQAHQVMFYAELILEDFYNTRIKPFGDDRNKYITQVGNHFSHVSNLTPQYLEYSREHRKMMLALLDGGFYDNFVS